MDHPFWWSNLTKTNKINNNNKSKYKLNSVARAHIQANINKKNKYKRIKRQRLVSYCRCNYFAKSSSLTHFPLKNKRILYAPQAFVPQDFKMRTSSELKKEN